MESISTFLSCSLIQVYGGLDADKLEFFVDGGYLALDSEQLFTVFQILTCEDFREYLYYIEKREIMQSRKDDRLAFCTETLKHNALTPYDLHSLARTAKRYGAYVELAIKYRDAIISAKGLTAFNNALLVYSNLSQVPMDRLK